MPRLLHILSRAPLHVLYATFAAVGWIAFHVVRWRRDVATANIARAFPEKDDIERRAIVRQSYSNLADLVAEALWGFGAGAEELGMRVTIENPEALTGHIAGGRSVLLLAAHFCNWEWLLLGAGAQLNLPIHAVYKPSRSRDFDAFVRAARGRFGGTLVSHNEFVSEVLKRRSETRVCAMVADQTPLKQDVRHWSLFLGVETAFFAGADTIARLLKAPVLYAAMRRVARGRYTVRLVPLAEPPYARHSDATIIDRYAQTLEAQIRESPPDWLWVHNKWKFGKSVRPS